MAGLGGCGDSLLRAFISSNLSLIDAHKLPRMIKTSESQQMSFNFWGISTKYIYFFNVLFQETSEEGIKSSETSPPSCILF